MRYYTFLYRNNKPTKFKAKEFVSLEDAWANCPDSRLYILAIGSLEELEKYKLRKDAKKELE